MLSFAVPTLLRAASTSVLVQAIFRDAHSMITFCLDVVDYDAQYET